MLPDPTELSGEQKAKAVTEALEKVKRDEAHQGPIEDRRKVAEG